jgi:hypothetical protein
MLDYAAYGVAYWPDEAIRVRFEEGCRLRVVDAERSRRHTPPDVGHSRFDPVLVFSAAWRYAYPTGAPDSPASSAPTAAAGIGSVCGAASRGWSWRDRMNRLATPATAAAAVR